MIEIDRIETEIAIFLVCVAIVSVVSLFIGARELWRLKNDKTYIPKPRIFYVVCSMLAAVLYWHAFVIMLY